MTHPETPFTRRNLPMLLLKARERVLSRFRSLLNANGVTEQQWRVIRTLLERGPMEPREIVDECTISSPSLAGMLARMDELGFVRREPHPHDLRRVRVFPTTKSRRMAARMAPQIEAIYARIEARIGEAFNAHVYDVLDELIRALDAEPVATAGSIDAIGPQEGAGAAGANRAERVVARVDGRRRVEPAARGATRAAEVHARVRPSKTHSAPTGTRRRSADE